MTGYILPFLFLKLECSAFTKLTNEVQLDYYVQMQQKSEILQAQGSKTWQTIKQTGHDMLFLAPPICTYVEEMQHLVDEQELVVHVLLPSPTSYRNCSMSTLVTKPYEYTP